MSGVTRALMQLVGLAKLDPPRDEDWIRALKNEGYRVTRTKAGGWRWWTKAGRFGCTYTTERAAWTGADWDYTQRQEGDT